MKSLGCNPRVCCNRQTLRLMANILVRLSLLQIQGGIVSSHFTSCSLPCPKAESAQPDNVTRSKPSRPPGCHPHLVVAWTLVAAHPLAPPSCRDQLPKKLRTLSSQVVQSLHLHESNKNTSIRNSLRFSLLSYGPIQENLGCKPQNCGSPQTCRFSAGNLQECA